MPVSGPSREDGPDDFGVGRPDVGLSEEIHLECPDARLSEEIKEKGEKPALGNGLA